jgi:hypothetical protein
MYIFTCICERRHFHRQKSEKREALSVRPLDQSPPTPDRSGTGNKPKLGISLNLKGTSAQNNITWELNSNRVAYNTAKTLEANSKCECKPIDDYEVQVQGTVYDVAFKLSLPGTETNESSIRVSSLYGMNFATGRNVCVKPDHSKSIFLYSYKLPAISEESGFLQDRSGFRFGWQFEIVNAEIPPTATRVPGNTIIISPAYTHHVTHFAESSIPLWHVFLHPDIYPVHSHADRIFLKQSDFHSELEWNREILRFISYHARNASIVDSSTFRSSTLICFDAAGMVGMGLHEFGFFANEGEAKKFRKQIVSFYRIPVQNHSSLLHKSRCLVLQRQSSRRLENRVDVIQAIEETGLYDCSGWSTLVHGEMEKLSFREQLSVVSSTHFLVGLHGSGLVNSIFLSTHAAAVDLLPHNYLELEWHNFASKAGVRFYFMFLGDTRCENPCSGHIFQTGLVKCRSGMGCNHNLVDFKLLQVIAAQADFHVRVSPNIRTMYGIVKYSGGAGRGDTPLLPSKTLALSLR